MSRKTWFYKTKIFVLISALSSNMGCANLFLEMADKTTDDALYFAAKLKADQYDWTGAITDIGNTTADFQARRDVRVFLAGLYAGRCGLDLIDLSNKIQNAGSTSLFSVLLAAFVGKTQTHLDDCLTAETILKSVGATAGTRTTEENIKMAFVAMAKMGVILNIRADADADGALDAGFTPCNSNTATGDADMPATDASNADLTEMITGIALVFTSLAGIGSSIGGATWDEIDTVCSTTFNTLGVPNICDRVNRADVGAGETKAMRAAIVDNTTFGLAVNDTTMCDFSSSNPCRCALSDCFSGIAAGAQDDFCVNYVQ